MNVHVHLVVGYSTPRARGWTVGAHTVTHTVPQHSPRAGMDRRAASSSSRTRG